MASLSALLPLLKDFLFKSTAKDSDDSSAGEVPNSPSLPEKPTPTKPSLTKSKIGPHPIPGSTELPNKLHKEVEKSMKRTSKWLSEKANLAFEDFSMSIKDKEDVETSVKRRMKGVPCSRLPLGTEEDCTDEVAQHFLYFRSNAYALCFNRFFYLEGGFFLYLGDLNDLL